MTPETATIVGGVVSGILGGGLAVGGALWAVGRGIRNLEDAEIRRNRVSCVTNIYGLCPIFSSTPAKDPPRTEDVAAFSFEINRAKLLFAGNPSDK